MEANIRPVTVERCLDHYYGSHIGKSLLLVDNVKDYPISHAVVRMQCMCIVLITRGELSYIANTQVHQAKANDFLVLSRGQVIDNMNRSDDCEGFALFINYDFFREAVTGFQDLSTLFVTITLNPVLHFSKKQVEEFHSYYKLMKSKVDDNRHHFRTEMVGSMLKTIIYDISNAIYHEKNDQTAVSKTRSDQIFGEFIALVHENYKVRRTVGWYAEQLSITPKYLAEMVKQTTHRSPNEWIDGYVIMEIRMLLRYTSKSVKEIAQIMNFTSQSFLGKYFKEHVGLSPKEYRKG